MIETFTNNLSEQIRSGLPGLDAHKIMAPVTRPIRNFEEKDFPLAKKGAVLILFYPVEDEIFMVLIKRPSYDGVHGGQVSFPGGKVEQMDTDSANTALRETEEEVGVRSSDIKIFGQLSNIYIPPSNFFVYPYLGFVKEKPIFFPDNKEVEYIIETPVNILMDQTIKSTIKINRNDINFEAPCYIINKHRVWGATAIILSELEVLMRDMK